MKRITMAVVAIAGVGLAACGGGDGSSADATAVLTEACNTQQGIGWLKKEYGEGYCDCWVSQAPKVLSAENYAAFVKANEAELAAADDADRENIARQNTTLYSSVSSAASACMRGK